VGLPLNYSPRRSFALRFQLGRSFWTLSDQAVVSLGNFGTNLILARHLPALEYGAFALLFGVLLFINRLHSSLVTYPVSSRGAAATPQQLKHMTALALVITCLLVIPCGLVVGVAAYAVDHFAATLWILGAGLAWQLQEVTRRALFAHLRQRDAIWGDGISYLGQAVCLGLTIGRGLPFWAIFAILAATSLAGAAVQAAQLGLAKIHHGSVVPTALEWWRLGRWVMFTNLCSLVTVQASPWVLTYFYGTVAAGAVQAVTNLLGVSHPVMFGMSGLVVPLTAHTAAREGRPAAARAAIHFTLQGVAMLVPYYLILLLVPHLALRIFYGPTSPYLAYAGAVRWFAIGYTFLYLAQMLGGLMNGLESNKEAFNAQAAAMAITAFVALPMAALGGVTWACAGVALASITRFAASVWLMQPVIRQTDAKPRAVSGTNGSPGADDDDRGGDISPLDFASAN